MTCIVGIADGTNVYIGADSAAVSGWERRATLSSKVFKTGPFLIGYTSSFRMGNLLQYQLKVEPQGDESDIEYMVRTFAEAVRNCLKQGGYTIVNNNREEGGTFLVGYRGHLYGVQGDFQVNEYRDGMDAVGAGAEYALGALVALEDWPPKRRILAALKVSAYFCAAVMPPFVVMKI